MSTLATFRTRLRRWLEDESASPLWSDDQLDEGLSVGLDEVSNGAPEGTSAVYAVTSGDTSIAVPATYERLVRLFDPCGVSIPFDVVDTEIRPAYGGAFDLSGNYLLVYLTPLSMPGVDTAEMPCPPRLEALLLASAAYWCLSERATSESKRGGMTSSEQARLEATRQDLETLRRLASRGVASFSLVV